MTNNQSRILVVDDDMRLRILLNRYLDEQGFAEVRRLMKYRNRCCGNCYIEPSF